MEDIGEYRVVQKIGSGAFGSVYEATSANGARVAIKVLHATCVTDALRARFRAEARALGALGGGGIPRLIEAHLEDTGRMYIVMEFVDGLDCYSFACDPRRNMPLSDRLRMFREVLQIIARTHEKHILHRDLKPANIRISEDGSPSVVDWGLAAPSVPGQDPHGSFAGTIAYLAPEVLRGAPASETSEVFSLGVLLVELALGHRPFPIRENPWEQAQVIRPLIRPEDLDCDFSLKQYAPEQHALWRAIHRVWRKALEPDPRNRYASVVQLREDIEAVLEGKQPAHADGEWAVRWRRACRQVGGSATQPSTWSWLAALILAGTFVMSAYSTWDRKAPVRYLPRSHAAWSMPWPDNPTVVAIYSEMDFGELHFQGLKASMEGVAGLHLAALGIAARVPGTPQDPEGASILKDPSRSPDAFRDHVERPLRDLLRTGNVVAVVGPCHTNAVRPVLDIVHEENPGIPVVIESPISREALGGPYAGAALSDKHPVYRISSGVEDRAQEIAAHIRACGNRSIVVWEDSGHGRDLRDALQRVGALNNVRTARSDLWNPQEGDIVIYLGVRAGFDAVVAKKTPDTRLLGCMMGWHIAKLREDTHIYDISDLLPGRTAALSRADAARLNSVVSTVQPSMRDEVFSFEAGLILRKAWAAVPDSRTANACYADALHGLTTALERPEGFTGAEGEVKFARGGGQDLEVSQKFETWQLWNGTWLPADPCR